MQTLWVAHMSPCAPCRLYGLHIRAPAFYLSTGYAGVQILARETHDLSCQGTRCSPPLVSLIHEATSLPVAPELTFPKIL